MDRYVIDHDWEMIEQAYPQLKVVSEILGHANIAVTADLYSHVSPSMMEEATTAVAGLIFG
jgi:site-specific recombinase XerD